MLLEELEEMDNELFSENEVNYAIELEKENIKIIPLVDFDQLYNMECVNGPDKILSMIELGKNYPLFWKSHPSTTVKFWNHILKSKKYGKILKGMKAETLKKYYAFIRQIGINEFTKYLIEHKSLYNKLSIKTIINNVKKDMLISMLHDNNNEDNAMYEDSNLRLDDDNDCGLENEIREFFPSLNQLSD